MTALDNEVRQLAFSVEEYEGRLDRLQGELARRGLAGMLVHTPENITYLTGFQTPGYYAYQCLVVPQTGRPVLVVRKLEQTNVDYFAWITETAPFEDHQDPVSTTAAVLSDLGLGEGPVGAEFDSWFVTIRQSEQLNQEVGQIFVDAGGTVEGLRLIKSPAEVAHIRTSCAAAQAGLKRGIEALGPGVNENEVAAAVHEGVILAGGEHPGLPPFILSGPRTMIPHGTWGGRRIEQGDPIYFEICGTTFRYTGARMHGAVVGTATDAHRRLAAASIAGVLAAIEAIAPGVPAEQVDRACRRTIQQHGFGPDEYRHRCGYSIGVSFPPDWGEGHIFSLREGERRELRAGMTFHMPPAIFDHEHGFAFGFSHSVLVTEDGCETLTDFPLELTEIR